MEKPIEDQRLFEYGKCKAECASCGAHVLVPIRLREAKCPECKKRMRF